MGSPFFSIILAVKNSAERIPPLLDSFRNQSFSDYELLVAASSPSESSLPVIFDALPTSVAKLVSEFDVGIFDAWNRALPFLSGEWTFFLGDDDALASPNVLQQLALHLITEPDVKDVDAVLCSALLAGRLVRPHYRADSFWKGMRFAHPSMLIRTSLLKNSAFDASFRVAGDFDYLLRSPQLRFLILSEYVLTSIGPKGISQTRLVLLAREVFRALRKNGYRRLHSIYYPFRIISAIPFRILSRRFGS